MATTIPDELSVSVSRERFEKEAEGIYRTHEAVWTVYSHVLARYEKRLPGLSTLTTDPQCGFEVLEALGNRPPPVEIAALDTSSWPSEVVLGLAILLRGLGPPLTDQDALDRQIQEGKKLVKLEKQKTLGLLDLVERVAPNLCALTGKNFAVRVLGRCGGLTALAKLPSDQLRLVGARDTCIFYGPRRLRGLLYECPLLRDMLTEMERAGVTFAVTDFRSVRRMVRQLANRIALVARIDCFEHAKLPRNTLTGSSVRSELRSLWRKEARQSTWDEPVDGNASYAAFGHLRALPIPRPWEKRRGRGGRKRTRRKQRARLASKSRQVPSQVMADDEIEPDSESDDEDET
jgi:hypothetical protein